MGAVGRRESNPRRGAAPTARRDSTPADLMKDSADLMIAKKFQYSNSWLEHTERKTFSIQTKSNEDVVLLKIVNFINGPCTDGKEHFLLTR